MGDRIKRKDLPPEVRVYPTWKELKQCAKDSVEALREAHNERKQGK